MCMCDLAEMKYIHKCYCRDFKTFLSPILSIKCLSMHMHLLSHIRCGCHEFTSTNQNKLCMLRYYDLSYNRWSPTTGPAGPSMTNVVTIDGPARPYMAAMDGPAGLSMVPYLNMYIRKQTIKLIYLVLPL